MKASTTLLTTTGLLLLGLTGSAQAAQSGGNRAGTYVYGFNVLYADSNTLDFEGGSTIELDDEYGLGFDFGYHVNDNLELQFSFDWMDVDYSARLVNATVPALSSNVRGTMESFTPQVSAAWYFGTGAIAPYVTGGVGWSFIDTNVPTGPPNIGCWWDPWYGQICTSYQNTKSVDELNYKVGAGIRFDLNRAYSLRLGYEKRWIELENASGDADFDLLSLGIRVRY